MKRIWKLLLSIIVTLSAGFIGSIFTRPAIPGWYAGLNKPPFNPPNWLFAPAWTTLFLLMAIALFIVWGKPADASGQKRNAIIIFIVQLFLNMAWSAVFFGMHSIGGAMVVIILLWFAILLNIFYFNKLSKPAALLLIPYILWVSFAATLNVSFIFLNNQ